MRLRLSPMAGSSRRRLRRSLRSRTWMSLLLNSRAELVRCKAARDNSPKNRADSTAPVVFAQHPWQLLLFVAWSDSMLRTLVLRPLPLKLLQNGHMHRHLSTSACSCARLPIVHSSKAEEVIAVVPGTVKEYEHHILIQTAPLKSDTAAKESHSTHGCWWPSVVEK